MIPIHKLVEDKVKEIRIIELGSLAQYNIMEPHRHDYVELFVFNKGGGFHEIDFHQFNIESKSIHIVSAGRVHKLQRDLKSEGYVILFHPSILESNPTLFQFLFELDCYDVTEYPPTFEFATENELEVKEIIESIWKYSNSEEKFKHQIILNKLSLLCIFCLKNVQLRHNQSSKDQETYIQFRKLLRQHYKSIKKVKEYAIEIGVSSRKLNDIISERTGVSASKTIQNQLVLEAKRLLNIGKSSKEIAFELNFEDPSHFSKFFKTQTGLSPSEFHKVHH